MVVMAVNIMENNIKHGSDDMVFSLLNRAQELRVPVVHSCLRKELGLAMYGRKTKKVPRAACFGLINPHGMLEEFKELLVMHQEAREQWEKLSKAS